MRGARAVNQPTRVRRRTRGFVYQQTSAIKTKGNHVQTGRIDRRLAESAQKSSGHGGNGGDVRGSLEKIGAPVEFELDTQACRLALRASQTSHRLHSWADVMTNKVPAQSC
jgi:hypothetical protein